MKTASLFLLSLLSISSLLFAQEKSEALIIKTGSIGKIQKSRVLILEKAFESKLDEYFSIVPKELFEEAKEQAFKELEFDECTDDQCVVKIQEILQVENAFKMVLTIEEGDTHVSLTWNNQEKKSVEENFCVDCNTKQLRKMIGKLVEKLVSVKKDGEKDKTESTIKETIPFGYTLSLEYDSVSTTINKLLPSLSASNEIAISWGILGVGLGFGEEDYIGFRFLSGSGETDSFYFSSGSTTGLADSVSVQVTGIYYTPSYKKGWVYGVGLESWQLVLGTSLGKQTIQKNVPLVDGGYQLLVKEYPINLKARWSTFGIVYNINLGWKFSIN